MKSIERVNILGVGISILNLNIAETQFFEAADKPEFQGFVTITGVHGVVESQKDEELKKIHNRSFLSTPDGMPMVWMGKWNGNVEMGRVYGPEIMLKVINATNESGHKHFFFGGAEGVADELKNKLLSKYKKVKIVGSICPPFRPLDGQEEQDLYDQLQENKPHFFWVGLSTPKQEKFMHGFLAKFPDLTKGWDHGLVMVGVGAAFDFHSGRVKQAPFWIQRSGFEWLYRITQDPKRLLKRYVVSNSYFVSRILFQMTGFKDYKLLK